MLTSTLLFAQNISEIDSIRANGYQLTNPVLDCDVDLVYIPPFKHELDSLIQIRYRNHDAEQIAVYFRQLKNGYSFQTGSDLRFKPSMLLRLAEAMQIMKMAENNASLLDETIVFNPSFPEETSGKLKPGKSYRIKDLIYYSILHPESEASDLLHTFFGESEMWRPMLLELGMISLSDSSTQPTFSVKEYATFLRVLYNCSHLTRKSSKILLDILTRVDSKLGLRSGVALTGISMASIYESEESTELVDLTQATIVYVKGNPYLLAIHVTGTQNIEIRDVCSDASELIYAKCSNPLQSEFDKVPLVNPALDCAPNPDILKPFKSQLEDLTQKLSESEEITEVSVYFRHLPTGHTIEINGDVKYQPASTMKIAHMIGILNAAQRNPSILNKPLKYDADIPVRRQNITDETLQLGSEYTMFELVKRMIIYSDNAAADLLHEYIINQKKIWDVLLSELGLEHVFNQPLGAGMVTAKEMAIFLRVLYNATYMNREYSELALGLLTKTRFTKGIRNGIPDKRIRVASKFGERSHDMASIVRPLLEHHDMGIIYFRNNPYILCVMTKGYNFDAQANAISEISKAVFEEMEHQYADLPENAH